MLMAVAKTLRDNGKKTIYVRTDTFSEHVVNAIRQGEMQKFREAYRNADALFLDDAQFLSRKNATQEELFHTFNALHMEGKTIVIGANCYPKDMVEIEPRLVSRFEWGIVLPVALVKEKKRLLENKAKSLHYPIPPKVAEFLIESFPSSPKALMHAFEALVLRSHIHKSGTHSLFRPMTVQLAKHYLADLLLAEAQSALTPQKIIQCCSDHYGIRPEDILSKAQTRDCVEPRQLSMYLCRKNLKLPFTKIGEIFGRDHSTVMTSVKQIQSILEQKNADLLTALAEIEKKTSMR
ncbi:MAG: DnaA ATPase domain-containing protein [Parachlamydiaceae bacterium]